MVNTAQVGKATGQEEKAMVKLDTIVCNDLVVKESGVTLANIKSEWTDELLESCTAKKEFRSKNGLEFLAAARVIDYAPTLDIFGGGLKESCEFAFFVKVNSKWCLCANTHAITTTDRLPLETGDIVAFIKNNDIKISHSSVILDASEAMNLVSMIGPSLGCDHTYDPVYPSDRRDICAVKRLAENGSDYGFDTIYLVWKTQDGNTEYREIANSRDTKDYIHIKSVEVKDKHVNVDLGSGGSYSGTPWNETVETKIS